MSQRWLRGLARGAAFPMLLAVFAIQAPIRITLAQQGPEAKSPEQAIPKNDPTGPAEGDESYKIRSNVQLVTTPVTVFDTGGQFVYDLQQDEFKVFDNGRPQRISTFDSETRKLSLVIVIETNEATDPFLESVRPLGSIFSEMVMGPQGEVAVLTYSDHVEQVLPFTTNGDKLETLLHGLHGRGGGMHLDDALARALSMLDTRAKENRKVAIIFSDGFNIHSQMNRAEIVKRAMNSNITLYGLGFSPLEGLWKRPPKDSPPDIAGEIGARSLPPNQIPTPTNSSNIYDTPIPMAQILLGLGEEMKKPIFKSSLQYYARYSGGEYFQKWGKDTVQQALNTIATEIHSQYELAYAPDNFSEIGFHKIEVQVRRPGAKVRARAGWFYQGEPERGVNVK